MGASSCPADADVATATAALLSRLLHRPQSKSDAEKQVMAPHALQDSARRHVCCHTSYKGDKPRMSFH